MIHPASQAATFDFLMWSKSEVFQWSTCPIIEITGGLGVNFEESSSCKNEEISHKKISSVETQAQTSLSSFTSKASVMIEADSKSIFELIFTIIPFFINSAISLGKGIQIFSDNSFTGIKSQIVIFSPFLFTKFCFISSTFFSSFLVFF